MLFIFSEASKFNKKNKKNMYFLSQIFSTQTSKIK